MLFFKFFENSKAGFPPTTSSLVHIQQRGYVTHRNTNNNTRDALNAEDLFAPFLSFVREGRI